MFLMEISETPEAFAKSVCVQPISARAARICPAVITAGSVGVLGKRV